MTSEQAVILALALPGLAFGLWAVVSINLHKRDLAKTPQVAHPAE